VPLRVVVTTRDGGVSRSPYDENNLALHVGDDPRAVHANRSRLAASLGVDRVVFMEQVHGCDVAVVRNADDDPQGVDALVTQQPGVAIAVLVADCVPVVISADRAVAVVHAGRRGVQDGVVNNAVEQLRSVAEGALSAQVGPAVCGSCYEVPEAMQQEVSAVVPAAASTTRQGTPGLDLVAGVRAQLAALGVEVAGPPVRCTMETPQLYSHRRDGVTGRFAMVALLQALAGS
jgi:YfiH family protein